MKALLLLSLLTNIACTTLPERQLASEDVVVLGQVDPSKSSLRLFPSEEEQLFVLDLRDKDKRLVDIESSDVEVTEGGKKRKVILKRLSKGRYLLQADRALTKYSQAVFKVQKHRLAHNLTAQTKPKKSQSRMEIVEQKDHEIVLRLTLKDATGRSIATAQTPEIILEGMGELSSLDAAIDGTWQFRLHYPEMNQVLYLSVRSQGVLLERVFRFQHVEK